AQEAYALLPELERVQLLLTTWHAPDQDRHRKQLNVAALFPEEIGRLILSGSATPTMSQFDENEAEPRRHVFGDFFAYLDQCPLEHAGTAPITFEAALKYWSWIDNIKAIRTFLRDESVRQPVIKRMQQATQLYYLVEMIRSRTNVDLCTVQWPITRSLAAFLNQTHLKHFALVVDSFGEHTLLQSYKQNTFIRHRTFGDALRAAYDLSLPSSLPLTAQYAAWILKAAAANIQHHQDVFQRRPALDRDGIALNALDLCAQLRCVAGHLAAYHTAHQSPVQPSEPWDGVFVQSDAVAAVQSILRRAVIFTDILSDSASPRANASDGLLFLLKSLA
ncbi:MAG TPA: hypothetical protein VGD58_15025, partial [Herpetosiphonaceae bacterium]